MSRIEKRFKELKDCGEKALVCFLTAGYPDLQTSEELICEVIRSSADIVELGVPFSDPLADGPSIQAASDRALAAGATIHKVMDLVKNVRKKVDSPLVLMTYYNPVQKFGLNEFARTAADAGADGVIVTDLPPEEAGEWKAAAQAAGLDTVFLLAPTSTDERIRRVAEMSSGFIYCVSRTGVTGKRSDVPSEVGDLIERIRLATDKPVAVGFGVSAPDHVRAISKWADGVVVGSALIDLIAQNSGNNVISEVKSFVSELKSAARET